MTLRLDEEDLAALDGQDLESLFGIDGVSVSFDEAAWSARERLVSSLAAVTGMDVDDAIVSYAGSLASSDWADTLSSLGSPLDEEALLKAAEFSAKTCLVYGAFGNGKAYDPEQD